MKKIILFLTISMFSVFLAACGNILTSANTNDESEEVVRLRLGHGGTHGDIIYQSIDVFSEYIKEKTNGQYIVENYGASQLGNERDLIEGVTLGTVDMTLVTNSPLGNFVPEALFYDLPGLFTDLEHVYRVAESDIVQGMLSEKLLEKNIRFLTTTVGGFRNMTNSTRPINELKDLDGISMRVQESPMILKTYEALPGVTPIPVPIGDLYSSLEQGVVDGLENPSIMIKDFNFFEVQEFMTITQHSFFPRHVFINEDVWQQIPEDVQEIFHEAANELQTYKNNYYEKQDPLVVEELESLGMKINYPDNAFVTEFNNLMREEVYPQFYDEIGGGDVEKGKEIVEKITEMGNK